MQLLALAAVLGLGLYAYQGNQFREKAQFKLLKVRFDFNRSALSLFSKLYFETTCKLTNPTDFTMRVAEIKFSASLAGNIAPVALVETKNLVIEKNGSQNFVVPCEIKTLQLFRTIQSASDFLRNNQPLNFKLIGEAKTQVGVITFNETVQLLNTNVS